MQLPHKLLLLGVVRVVSFQIINRQQALCILRVSPGTLEQQRPHYPGGPEVLGAEDREVQGCHFFVVHCVEVSAPGNQVLDSELGTLLGSPVQWCIAPGVALADLEAVLEEERYRLRAVSLGAHMQQINPLTSVQDVQVPSEIPEHPHHFYVAEESGVVERGEALGRLALRVDPRRQRLPISYQLRHAT